MPNLNHGCSLIFSIADQSFDGLQDVAPPAPHGAGRLTLSPWQRGQQLVERQRGGAFLIFVRKLSRAFDGFWTISTYYYVLFRIMDSGHWMLILVSFKAETCF